MNSLDFFHSIEKNVFDWLVRVRDEVVFSDNVYHAKHWFGVDNSIGLRTHVVAFANGSYANTPNTFAYQLDYHIRHKLLHKTNREMRPIHDLHQEECSRVWLFKGNGFAFGNRSEGKFNLRAESAIFLLSREYLSSLFAIMDGYQMHFEQQIYAVIMFSTKPK